MQINGVKTIKNWFHSCKSKDINVKLRKDYPENTAKRQINKETIQWNTMGELH